MREIRFRGKDIKTKEWVYGHLFFFDDGRYFISPKGAKVEGDNGNEPSEFILRGVKCFEVEPKTVGQFVGLSDKYAAEIIEGDIGWDEHFECYGIVAFDEGKFSYDWEDSSDDLLEVHKTIEFVGNIHDNPEFLGKNHV